MLYFYQISPDKVQFLVYIREKYCKAMIEELKYGKVSQVITLPENAEKLEVKVPEFTIDKAKFKKDLSKHLPVAERYGNIAIVVADKTRLCGYPEYLPWLLESLEAKGSDSINITFYIAYGTHPKQTEEESFNSYGEIYKKYKFVHHDCTQDQVFSYLGTTQRGTDIRVRKDILESTLVITFGAISHHYFAGYGGGRKLLFPGLAPRKDIYKNHSLFLDNQKRILAEGCQPGKLEGNPLAEDLREIDTYLPPKISIHGILDNHGKVCQLMVGGSYHDFEKACKVQDTYYSSGVNKQYDLVVASCGGYPKDINFIQAHKAVHNSAAFVKDGGKLIVLAECIDGIASKYFTQYLETGSFEKSFAILEKNYEGNGGTALAMMTKTNRINISMRTSLDEETCKLLNVSNVSEDKVQEIINNEQGSIALIQNASLLVK